MSCLINKIRRIHPLLRIVLYVIYDMFAVCMASFFALFIRYDFRVVDIPIEFINRISMFLPFGVIITVVLFAVFRLYNTLWAYAGLSEIINIAIVSFLIAFIEYVAFNVCKWFIPRSYYLIIGIALFTLTFLSRFSYRFFRENKRIISNKKNANNVLVIGAGDAGNVIVKELKESYYSQCIIKGIIDDDKSKKGKYVQGIRVLGNRNSIKKNVKKYSIDEIIIAIPSASRKVIKEILDICSSTDCELRILPGLYQLANGEISVTSIRNVEIEDLLGREPITIDTSTVVDYVKGSVVLITGGGGSIGSEICRQIAKYEPKKLIIVDIYENNAYDIQQELIRHYPSLDLVVLIASVRDTKRVNAIFEKYKPEIVYHAAAHKHVPLMENSPNEAIKNNVFGTLNVAEAAGKNACKRFVLISTDKAVNPTNIMGASKRICEMIVQTYNAKYRTEYVAVRFGNVLGSNGSVIPLFKKQIEEGGPITVTHPDIIRYFMTIPEAVLLVLQAGAYAKGGEIFVLDMGEPVKIVDLAKNLIKLSGYRVGEDIEIVYTGLRPGEKLYEELLMEEEGLQSTENQLIHIGTPICMDNEKFENQLVLLNNAVEEDKEIKDIIKMMVPTYNRV